MSIIKERKFARAVLQIGQLAMAIYKISQENAIAEDNIYINVSNTLHDGSTLYDENVNLAYLEDICDLNNRYIYIHFHGSDLSDICIRGHSSGYFSIEIESESARLVQSTFDSIIQSLKLQEVQPQHRKRIPEEVAEANISRSEGKAKLQIFLCHASEDKQSVRDLYKRLRDDGFNPWLDIENLLPGEDWELMITKAVRESDIVIICLSRESISKTGFVQKEIKHALDVADEQPEDAIFLIPLKLEECVIPERLKRWQWVNYFNTNGYDRLLRALNSKLGISIR